MNRIITLVFAALAVSQATQASSPVSMVSSLLMSGANLEARADSPTANLAAGAAKLCKTSACNDALSAAKECQQQYDPDFCVCTDTVMGKVAACYNCINEGVAAGDAEGDITLRSFPRAANASIDELDQKCREGGHTSFTKPTLDSVVVPEAPVNPKNSALGQSVMSLTAIVATMGGAVVASFV